MSPVLIGRDQDLRALLATANRAAAGGARVIGVEGPAGIGKSTLLAGLVKALPPGLLLRTRLDPTGSSQLGDAVSRVAADVGWGPLPEEPEPAKLARWMAQRIEDAGGFATLVFDDAQWLDERSLAVLTHLLRQVSDLPLCLVLGVRSPVPEVLEPLVRQAKTAGMGSWNVLQPLGVSGIRDLLASELGITPDAAAVSLVQEVTGGYPIYVSEIGRQLMHNDDPRVGLSELLTRLRGSAQDKVLTDTVETALADAPSNIHAAHLAVCLGEELSLDQVEEILGVLDLTMPPTSRILQTELVERTSRGSLRPRHAMLAQAVIDRASPLQGRPIAQENLRRPGIDEVLGAATGQIVDRSRGQADPGAQGGGRGRCGRRARCRGGTRGR